MFLSKMRFLSLFFVFISTTVVFCFDSSVEKDFDLRAAAAEALVVLKTIVVDQSGRGDFTEIQSAINSVPDFNSHWIRIRVRIGVYREKVTVPREKPFILLEGDGQQNTIIVWGDATSTAESATFSVWADNFIARYVTFQNSYNYPIITKPMKQAVALLVFGDKCSFYECGFIGVQDTLCDWSGRHYFHSCYIEGAVDFIFGIGQSIYESCAINVTALPATIPHGVVTAQGRDSPTDGSGFVFKYGGVYGNGKTNLGRAWRPYSRVIFYRSYLSTAVLPGGWDAWNSEGHEGNIMYAEHGCEGPGSNMAHRVKWVKNLSESEATRLASLTFIDNEGWLAKQP